MLLRWRTWLKAFTCKGFIERSTPKTRLLLEMLEDRTLLSTSIPLSPTTWTPMGPAPIGSGSSAYSGRINAIAADPTNANIIYIAASSGGVWKTVDGGSHWVPLTDNLADASGNPIPLSMGAIVVDPLHTNIIYAGAGDKDAAGSGYGRGILKSTDGGSTWILLDNGGNFARTKISRIVVDPTNDNNIFAAVNYSGGTNYGIFKSTNGGLTWTNTTGNTWNDYSDLVIDPNASNILYMAISSNYNSPAGVYKSTNAGASWSLLTAAPSGATVYRPMLAMSSDSSTLYVSMVNASTYLLYKMLKSTDGGASFTDLTSNTPNYGGDGYSNSLAVLPGNPNVVFAGGSSNWGDPGIIESTNGGASWSNIQSDGATYVHTDSHAMAFDANGNLLEGDDGGIYRLNNRTVGSLQWQDLNGNLQITEFVGVALDPTNSNIAYGGSQDNGTEKFNDSLGWSLVWGGDGGYTRVDPFNSSTVYGENIGISSFRSDNAFASGSPADISTGLSGPVGYPYYVLDPSTPNRVLWSSDKLFESLNRGSTWTAIGTPNSNGFNSNDEIIRSIAVAPSDPKTIYVAADGVGVFVTTNGTSGAATTWTQISVPGYMYFSSLAVDPLDSQTAYITCYPFSSGAPFVSPSLGGHVFKTTNRGSIWTDISAGLPNIPTWSIALDPRGTTSNRVVYVGTDTGVYFSFNGGSSWLPYKTGLPNARVHELSMAPNLGILASGTYGRGMYETQFFTTLVNVSSGNLTIADIAQGVQSDTLTIQANTTTSQYIITDPNNSLGTIGIPGGFTSVDGHTATVPFAAVTGTQINVNTAGGDDSLTVDFSRGTFPKPINYNGGTGTNTLLLKGSSFATETVTATNSNSGTITLSGHSITFSSLSSVTDLVTTTNATIKGTSNADQVNLVNGPVIGGFQTAEINSGNSTFTKVDFANKAKLNLQGVAGVDTFTLANNNLGQAAGLTILNVVGGTTAGVIFNVQTTPSAVTTNVVGNASAAVNVGSAAGLQGILGTVNIENPPSVSAITVDDSADSFGRTVALSSFAPNLSDSQGNADVYGKIHLLAPGDINYEFADTGSLTINGCGLGNTFDVQAVGTNFVTTLNGGSGSDYFKVDPQATGTNLSVNGQAPSTSPGDTIFYNGAGTLNPGGSGSGTIAQSGQETISFTGMESVQVGLPRTPLAWNPIGPAPLTNGSPGGGAVSGRITGIAADTIDPNTIFVATAGGGVWKTTNDGTSWVPLTDNLASGGKPVPLFMGAIAESHDQASHQVIYAGTGEANNSLDSLYGSGIIVSTDGGTSWTLENNGGVFTGATVSKIAIDPSDLTGGTAYAALAGFGTHGVGGNTGIWKTTNFGASWTNTTSALANSPTINEWSDVIIDPHTPSTIYAAEGTYFTTNGLGTGNGVYKSTDSGKTWILLNGTGTFNGTQDGRIALSLFDNGTSQALYVSIATPKNDGIANAGELFKMLKSVNGGTTFTDLTLFTPNYMGTDGYGQGWYDTTLAVSPTDPNVVFAGGSDNHKTNSSPGIIETRNGGTTWSAITTSVGGSSIGPHTDHHAAAFDATGKLLDGNDGGIFRLNDPNFATLSWADLNGNLNTIQFTGIAIDPSNPNIAYGGSQDNGTEEFTGSLGWTQVFDGDGGITRIDPTDYTRIYQEYDEISLQSFSGGTVADITPGIVKHTDANGDIVNFYAPYVLDSAGNLYYGSDYLNFSANHGSTWSQIGTPGTGNFNPSDVPIDAIAVAPANNAVIYVAAGGKIFVTQNTGTSWTERDLPDVSAGSGRNSIAVASSDATGGTAYAVIDAFSGGGKHVYKTTNFGAAWTDISANLLDTPVASVAISADGATIYVGTDVGVYVTTNAGSTWSTFRTGFPNAQVVELELVPGLGLLAAGTHGRGLWEIALNPLSITTTTLPNWTLNKAGYNQSIVVTGGVGTKTFSVSGTLPPGLSLDSSTGAITGTPTVANSFSFTITVTDTVGAIASQAYLVVINPAVTINTATLADWTVNKSGYSQFVVANGGTGTKTFSVSAGTLPTGLSLNSATGAITGTPTAANSFSFTITATDTVSAATSKAYTVIVNAAVGLNTFSDSTAGILYNKIITATGGTGNKTMAVSNYQAGGTGLAAPTIGTNTVTFNSAPTTAGTVTFDVSATDSVGASASQHYAIIINPPVSITPVTLPNWTLNKSGYSQTVVAAGGTGAKTFAVSAGSLPGGLSLNATSGAITGTPSASGTFNFTVTATDTVSATGSRAYTVVINAAVNIITATLVDWTAEQVGVRSNRRGWRGYRPRNVFGYFRKLARRPEPERHQRRHQRYTERRRHIQLHHNRHRHGQRHRQPRLYGRDQCGCQC